MDYLFKYSGPPNIELTTEVSKILVGQGVKIDVSVDYEGIQSSWIVKIKEIEQGE
jgi:hypothetical protein